MHEEVWLVGLVFLWCAVQFARAAGKRGREWLAVGRADDAGRPADGAAVVVRGALQSTVPLSAPISGRPAVAYGYHAWRREERPGVDGTSTDDVVYVWGEGSAPCALLTRHGTLAVRGRL